MKNSQKNTIDYSGVILAFKRMIAQERASYGININLTYFFHPLGHCQDQANWKARYSARLMMMVMIIVLLSYLNCGHM